VSVKSIQTKKTLLAHYKNGNRKAFETLFDMYWEDMFLRANSILRDRYAAQDVVQRIWINLWTQRKVLEIKDFEAYIFRSVRYGCYKYLRDNKFSSTHLQIIDSLAMSNSEVEDRHNFEATQRKLDTLLNRLPPRCQKIFRLSRFEDATNDEIALKLGISKRSVENQVYLALKAIRRHLASFQIIFLLFLLYYR